MTAVEVPGRYEGGAQADVVLRSTGEVLAGGEGQWNAWTSSPMRMAQLDGNEAGWAVAVFCDTYMNKSRGRLDRDVVPILLRHLDFDVAKCPGWRRVDPDEVARPPAVYFVEAENGLIKIGFSATPAARLKALQTASPERLRMVGVVAGLGAEGEAELHDRFAADRSHGEWFRSSPELMAFIAENARPL